MSCYDRKLDPSLEIDPAGKQPTRFVTPASTSSLWRGGRS
jgi:hypothetical protein